MTKRIMIQGTMSDAGKSIIAAALCRIFTQDGYRVAPFKSQNMALNSYITADQLEMGRAQVVQAQAAGKQPDVRMNPILLKPSSDTGSQLIVLGEVRGDYDAVDYFKMKNTLVPDIMYAYNSLAAENDIIVIEGAGSPAEINLMQDDIVNMGLAQMVDAPVLLVGDIDRGGVFAQLYGTVELLEPQDQQRIVGLVINKFRGDVEILKPGLTQLEQKAGIPVLGVVPMAHVDIDDEDSMASRLTQTQSQHKPLDVAVIRLGRISNFTDFTPLERHPAVGVRYVGEASELGQPDLIVLPGTKNTIDDLLRLRQNGLETAIKHRASAGTPVLGVCGGFQMMGAKLLDPLGIEHQGEFAGMGLLPCVTEFEPQKTRTRVNATVLAPQFSGAQIEGYEIHMGTTQRNGADAFCTLDDGREDGAVWGNVFGTYLHGLFDTADLLQKLADWLLQRKGLEPSDAVVLSHDDYQETQFDLLAQIVRDTLDIDAIYTAMDQYEKHDQ